MKAAGDGGDRRALLQNALNRIEELERQLERAARQRSEPVAIVGIGCRYPGGIVNADTFWQVLRDGVDAITHVPEDRRPLFDGDPDARWAGFLSGVDQFEPAFFGISPREATTMDPQHRLVLEVAWEALEHAAIAPSSLFGSRTGVFVGITTHDYGDLAKRLNGAADVYVVTGNGTNAVAGRLSYTLGLQGPSVAVDTACSSSLVATHLAVQSLRTGDSDLALAGGVNLTLLEEGFRFGDNWGMLAPDGRCKTFDARANGFVRAEGCGIVVLKRLADAERDGDRILGVIVGSAVNQDGRSSGFTVPNGLAQQAVIRQALADAQLTPDAVTFVETHGTGTSLGDPIEVEALGAVFGPDRPRDQPLMLGAVKSNFGHAESAAGIAGLIKAVLSLQHAEIPRNLHLQQPNPQIPWSEFPFQLPTTTLPWSVPDGRPRVAGVTSFGVSGTNAHVLVSEAPPRATPNDHGSPAMDRPRHILALSAKTPAALTALAKRYADHLNAHPGTSLADLSSTANAGRSHFTHRLAITAQSAESLRDQLQAAAQTRVAGPRTSGSPRVAFLFTGQGAQYRNMGRQLYETQPVFRATIDRCAELLRDELDRPLIEVLYPENTPAESSVDPIRDDMAYAQPAQFALQVALAELWRSWGIVPSAVLGHSVGEFAAACVAGVFSLRDGLRLVAARGRLLQSLPRDGEMVAIFDDPERVERAVARYAGDVAVAVVNGPQNVVISGRSPAVRAVVSELQLPADGWRRLDISHASHSPLVEPILDAFTQVAASVTYRDPILRLVSTATGDVARGSDATSPAYWRQHLRGTVKFAAAMRTARMLGCDAFVELGAHPTLLGLARTSITDDNLLWLPSLRRGRPDWEQLLESLGELYVAGADVDWAGFDRPYARSRVTAPSYPFQRQSYWIAAADGSNSATRGALPAPMVGRSATGQPLLGDRRELPPALTESMFEAHFSTRAPEYLDDHRVFGTPIFPGTGYLELGLELARTLGHGYELRDLTLHQPLSLGPDEARVVHTVARPEVDGSSSIRITSVHPGGPRLHASGRVSVRRRTDTAPAPTIRVETLAEGMAEQDVSAYHAFLSELGLYYGPSFQGLRRLWRGDGVGVGEVRLPAPLDGTAYQLHPALLDACFQVMGGGVPGMTDPHAERRAYMVMGVERLVVHVPGSDHLWVRARLRDPDTNVMAPAETFTTDLEMFDPDGRLVAEARGLCVKHASPAVVRSFIDADPSDWLYQVAWRPAPSSAGASTDEQYLIVTQPTPMATALARSLGARRASATMVRPDDAEQLSQLLQQGVTGVVCLSETPSPDASTAPDDVQTDELATAARVLHLAQTLLTSGGPVPRLWVATRGSQPVTDADPVALTGSSLWGLGPVARAEHPELACTLVDLDPTATAEDSAEALATELLSSEVDDRVAFRHGQRLVARLARLGAPSPSCSRTPAFADDATYLVTGGLGGLGLLVSRWLVTHGARHLVLVGRSAPTQVAAEALAELEAQGARVLVRQADVADEDAMRGVLRDMLDAGFPALRGVIHSAAVLDDGVLLQQNSDRFLAAMRPKVAGAWNLHRLTHDTPLDFFVLFSSGSALFGSRGQSNYAAANAFMDALARYRAQRGLPALSINWGAWAEVGRAAGMASRHHQHWSELGVQLMTPAQGLDVLGQLLNCRAAQVAAVPVDWHAIARSEAAPNLPAFFSELVLASPTPSDHSAPPMEEPSIDLLRASSPEDRFALLADIVRQQVASVLRIPPSELPEHQSLAELGLDSLMAVELRSRIERTTGTTLPLATILGGPTTATVIERIDAHLAAPAPEASVSIQSASTPATEGRNAQSLAPELLLERVPGLSDNEVDALLNSLWLRNSHA